MEFSKEFVVLDNARLEEQLQVMKEIKTQGVCPFCLEHLQRFHKQPILQNGLHWLLTYNQWPYEHTRLQLLLICKYHAQHLSDLRDGAGEELLRMFQWAEEEFKITSGSFVATRFGTAGPNGATVSHLHAHLVVGDGSDKVKFKMANSVV